MKKIIAHRLIAALLLGLLPWFSATAHAQTASGNYPNRPLRLIIPLAAGGLVDTFSRSLAQSLSERLGQPVVPDNRAGANQAIAGEAAAKAAPDGYTLFTATQSGLILNAAARKQLPFDSQRDFAPISLLFSTPFYLVVHPSVEARNVQELIALARAQPGKLAFASVGTGSAQHLAAELFNTQAKVSLFHVPYKASSQSANDLMGGRVQVMFEGGASSLPHVRAGKLRALAVTTQKRSEAMPDLPTMIESGLPGYDLTVWFGLVSSAGTPRPIIDRLNREVLDILRNQAFRAGFVQFGIDMTPSTPEELAERIRKDLPVWTKVMRDAGIQPE
jgi:tripartite-type tricarboxylate transporter receptor subunit TctC